MHPYLFTTLDSKVSWTDVLTALGTVGAVIVALFLEVYRQWRSKAYLNIKVSQCWPDICKVSMGSLGYVLFVRFRVVHVKGATAKDVEIFITNFERIIAKDKRERVSNFLPLNLSWSYFDSRRQDGSLEAPPRMDVLPRSYRHVDLGFFRKYGDLCAFQLKTAVISQDLGDGRYFGLFEAGVYEFEINLSGRNVDPVSKRWRLEFDGAWNEDEKVMLNEHIRIFEV